jgi:hypothetical protein
MKTFLILFLIAARIAGAQVVTQDNVKAWMIQHFQVPPDAEIADFSAYSDPTTGALSTAHIIWRTISEPTFHSRTYDFEKQIVTEQDN